MAMMSGTAGKVAGSVLGEQEERIEIFREERAEEPIRGRRLHLYPSTLCQGLRLLLPQG